MRYTRSLKHRAAYAIATVGLTLAVVNPANANANRA